MQVPNPEDTFTKYCKMPMLIITVLCHLFGCASVLCTVYTCFNMHSNLKIHSFPLFFFFRSLNMEQEERKDREPSPPFPPGQANPNPSVNDNCKYN